MISGWHDDNWKKLSKGHLRHLVDLTIVLVKLKNIEEATPWKMRKNVKKEFNFSILYYKAHPPVNVLFRNSK